MKLSTLALLLLLPATAQAQDMGVWTVLTPKGQDASLTFGKPGAEEATFRCVPKSGQVSVLAQMTRPLPARLPTSVTLASSPTSITLRGSAQPDAQSGGALVAAEYSTRAPLTASFKKTGMVSIAALGETLTLPPAPKGVVRKFFGVCK